MGNNKEKWINEILNSSKRIERVGPSHDLFERINKNIQSQNLGVFSLPNLRLIAAASILLILFNVSVLRNYSNTVFEPSDYTYQELYSDESFFTEYLTNY